MVQNLSQTAPHITILLCTCNGAAFLPEQLDSYLRQSHDNWSLWVSDDGSTDATPDILRAFQRDHGGTHDIRLLDGPCQGRAALNFMQLICHPDLPAGYVALSDQDDIWLPFKLERALDHLEGQAGPVLYSAWNVYIDDAGTRIGGRRIPRGLPVFETAMMQNFMPGHAMVFNPDGLALVRQAGVPGDIAYHDWWLTLLFTATDNMIQLDLEPVVLYRQHGSNVLGAPGGLRAGLQRIGKVFGRNYGDWVAANARALQAVNPMLTPAHQTAVARFLAAPRRGGPRRVWLLWRLGFYRQSRAETVFIYLMALFGRV